MKPAGRGIKTIQDSGETIPRLGFYRGQRAFAVSLWWALFYSFATFLANKKARSGRGSLMRRSLAEDRSRSGIPNGETRSKPITSSAKSLENKALQSLPNLTVNVQALGFFPHVRSPIGSKSSF